MPQRSKSKNGHDGFSVVRMLRLSSLGKKNRQKSSLVQVSKSGNDSLPILPTRRSCQEENIRMEVPRSGLKMSSNTGKFQKTSTLEETTLGESGSTRQSFSLKTPRADADRASAFKATSVGLVAHARQAQSANSNNSPSAMRLKVRMLLSRRSKSPNSSPKNSNIAGSYSRLPPTGMSNAHARTAVKTRRGTIMGTASSISELTTNTKHLNCDLGGEAIDKDMGGCVGSPLSWSLPSPYAKITAPQRLRHQSRVPSDELPPAIHCTTLLRHSDGSSGYESMRHDSETTGSISSAQDSSSEHTAPSSYSSRTPKSHKKRGNRFLRDRLISANFPDSCSVGGQWVDLPPRSSGVKQNFQLKVYEIDDMERLQERTEAVSGPEGLLDLAIWLRMLEKQQQQIQDLRNKYQQLTEELQEARTRIMVPTSKWCGQFDVDQGLDQNSQEYLEVLTRVTAELEICVNRCKSRVLMETSFDITSWSTTDQPEGRPDEEEDMART